jgi:hypothetical protein
MIRIKASLWRDWVGRAGALFCILFFLSLLDVFVAGFRKPANYLSCTPGQTLAVTGSLAERADHPGDLFYLSSSKDIRLVFDSAQAGFWSGGYMWRGRILVNREILPGRYRVAVPHQRDGKRKSASLFQVEVFKDEFSLRQASFSFILRYLAIPPWKAALFGVPFILSTFGAVFFLSYRTQRLLAQEGKAEVYRVLRGEKGYQIYFELGKNQGVLPGASVALFDEQKKPVGRATVEEVFGDYSIAQTGLESSVRPGFIVSRSG